MADPPAPTSQRLSRPEGVGRLRRERLQWGHLYFVCDARPNDDEPEALLRAALSGGVGLIELREKELGWELVERASKTFRRLADNYGAPFIVNDDPQLALALHADGVHVGQEDIDPVAARSVLGPEAIIGLSTHNEEQIAAAAGQPVDYISVGPIWETPTKQGRPATGLQLIRHAAENARLPWFAIGGIDLGNVDEVVGAGATRICAVRAIRDAEDPRAAASALRSSLDRDWKPD